MVLIDGGNIEKSLQKGVLEHIFVQFLKENIANRQQG
jgi:hypothetical protein